MEELVWIKRKNVSIALICIWLVSLLIYFIFLFFVKVPLVYSILIISTETFLCLCLWSFFMINIKWLKDIHTGKEINYLNISNVLSAVRFSLVPLLMTMFGLTINMEQTNITLKLIIFTFAAAVCFTDLFDGFLARKLNQVTKLGMILDPVGDFLMIICFSILVYVNGIIEWWFFSLIMIRIPGLIIISLVLLSLEKKIKMKTTPLGRTTIFYILCQLGISTMKLLLNIQNPSYNLFIFITAIIGSILLIVSSIEKIILMTFILKNQHDFKNNNEYIQL
jgi:cardiolipin synthase (CMP-forming)